MKCCLCNPVFSLTAKCGYNFLLWLILTSTLFVNLCDNWVYRFFRDGCNLKRDFRRFSGRTQVTLTFRGWDGILFRRRSAMQPPAGNVNGCILWNSNKRLSVLFSKHAFRWKLYSEAMCYIIHVDIYCNILVIVLQYVQWHQWH